MNGPGDIPLANNIDNPITQPCGLISIIPTLGMSSCRGRAEAFARRLSSKLRTLGSQSESQTVSQEDDSIVNGNSTNTWTTSSNNSDHAVTDIQPLRHETDSFFDFDCEVESPGSPVDECEYLRLIETVSNTPHNSATESGYACASTASSHSSTDGPFFEDPKAEAANHSGKHSSAQISHNAEFSSSNEDKLENCSAQNCKSTNSFDFDNDNDNDGINLFEKREENEEQQQKQVQKQEQYSNTPHQSSESENEIKEEEICNYDSKSFTDVMLSVQNEFFNDVHKGSEQTLVEATNCVSTPSSKEHSLTNVILSPPSNSKYGTSVTEYLDCSNKIAVEINSSEGRVYKDAGARENEENKENIDIRPADTFCVKYGADTTAKLSVKSTSQNIANTDTTDDEDDCRPHRVRRCSSLKTGKTPPGTPGRKKIVRFADVLGLDLADIKTFLDEIPTIPKSAFEDLEILDTELPIQLGPKLDRLLMPLFQQPGGLPTFLNLVREKQVSLENAAVTDHINQTITGSVRVRNLDFHKSVHIRYTLDNWRSFADLQANYVENSCDGFSDKFTFILYGNTLQIGERLEFAVRFQCKGQQYWDNNYGTNYCFQCLPTASPAPTQIQSVVPSHHTNNMTGMLSPTAGDAWCSSFY